MLILEPKYKILCLIKQWSMIISHRIMACYPVCHIYETFQYFLWIYCYMDEIVSVLRFFNWKVLRIYLSHACYTLHLFYLPCLNSLAVYYVWWWEQIEKLFITQYVLLSVLLYFSLFFRSCCVLLSKSFNPRFLILFHAFQKTKTKNSCYFVFCQMEGGTEIDIARI
jgi:hypothetical protein